MIRSPPQAKPRSTGGAADGARVIAPPGQRGADHREVARGGDHVESEPPDDAAQEGPGADHLDLGLGGGGAGEGGGQLLEPGDPPGPLLDLDDRVGAEDGRRDQDVGARCGEAGRHRAGHEPAGTRDECRPFPQGRVVRVVCLRRVGQVDPRRSDGLWGALPLDPAPGGLHAGLTPVKHWTVNYPCHSIEGDRPEAGSQKEIYPGDPASKSMWPSTRGTGVITMNRLGRPSPREGRRPRERSRRAISPPQRLSGSRSRSLEPGSDRLQRGGSPWGPSGARRSAS